MYHQGQMLTVGEALHVGAGDKWEPVISAQLCCQPKTAPKEKVLKKKKKHNPEKKKKRGLGWGNKALDINPTQVSSLYGKKEK